jgi:hypothetical protein
MIKMVKGLKTYLGGAGYQNTSTSSFQRWFGWEGLDTATAGTVITDRVVPLTFDGAFIKSMAHLISMRSVGMNLRTYLNGSLIDTLVLPASTTGAFESLFTDSFNNGDRVEFELDYNGGTGTFNGVMSIIYGADSR